LSLGGLFQAGAAHAASSGRPPEGKIRACIMIFYYGGPSHLDMWDMKPDAPLEVRGAFRPIDTSAPGVRVCEHLPMMARVMHRVALVRSVHHQMTAHDSASSETLTGRTPVGGDRETFPDTPQTFPAFGATLSRLRQERSGALPWAALPFVMNNVLRNPGQTPGFLGAEYAPFQVEADPATLSYHSEMLRLPEGVSAGRLEHRRRLLETLERGQAVLAGLPEAGPGRAFYARAFDLLASEDVRRALDIEQEASRTRERYGMPPRASASGGAAGEQHGYGSSMRGQNLLLARRLVESGVPFVNVYDFKQQGQNWDSHADGFNQLKGHLLPPMDCALSALIEDLEARGLLDTTLVLALGEFGRTPKVNGTGGRDHWPHCYTALLAGGGVTGGAVYGSSDETGSYPASDPVTPGDLAATIFWRFGIDPGTQIRDSLGRPFPAAEGSPIRELFGGARS
jgi:hypothetical protein